jgi:hypothetical protein
MLADGDRERIAEIRYNPNAYLRSLNQLKFSLEKETDDYSALRTRVAVVKALQRA